MTSRLATFSAWLLILSAAGAEEPFAPDQSVLPAPAPADAIVLFGDGVNEFRHKSGGPADWPVVDGTFESTSGPHARAANHVVSTWHFRDADIHTEFLLPDEGVGNSGLYIHGNYEMQIYNSHTESTPTDAHAGGMYGFHAPLTQAARPPGEWQVYDVRYRAPRRDESGTIVEEGSITAWLNGSLVLDDVRFGEPVSKYHPFRRLTTPYLDAIGERQRQTSVGPLFLQDHDARVRFRNVWIRPLDEFAGRYEP